MYSHVITCDTSDPDAGVHQALKVTKYARTIYLCKERDQYMRTCVLIATFKKPVSFATTIKYLLRKGKLLNFTENCPNPTF